MLSKDEGGGEEPFTDDLQLMMYSKTWNITCNVKIASEGKEMVMPGKERNGSLCDLTGLNMMRHKFGRLVTVFHYPRRLTVSIEHGALLVDFCKRW